MKKTDEFNELRMMSPDEEDWLFKELQNWSFKKHADFSLY